MKVVLALRALGVSVLLAVSACASIVPPSADRPHEARRSPLVEPPGALNPDVSQANIQSTICTPGWTATVRPSTGYTQPLKLKLLREAGLPASEVHAYELDHFVPLALGGHPRSPDNLWLQPWKGQWGASAKDVLERRLQVMVCRGEIELGAARLAIQRDWRGALRKYVDRDQRGELLGD